MFTICSLYAHYMFTAKQFLTGNLLILLFDFLAGNVMYYNVTGLTERTKYFINVIAVNEMGPGRKSETLEITTGKEDVTAQSLLVISMARFPSRNRLVCNGGFSNFQVLSFTKMHWMYFKGHGFLRLE